MSNASKILLTILMFIGGSPASTAGGVRVVAFAIMIATMISTLRGRIHTIVFWKKIPVNYADIKKQSKINFTPRLFF